MVDKTIAKPRSLGPIQKKVLESLRFHGSWSDRGCGWYWSTQSRTKRLMDSLVRSGHVTLDKGIYRAKKQE